MNLMNSATNKSTKTALSKGQIWRRKGDGFVFRVTSANRSVPGASMQCIDATRIFGWFYAEAISIGFDKVTVTEKACTW
jgi:hypothetical protein